MRAHNKAPIINITFHRHVRAPADRAEVASHFYAFAAEEVAHATVEDYWHLF
jgi:hypothetical protein